MFSNRSKKVILTAFLTSLIITSYAQSSIPLWQSVPNSQVADEEEVREDGRILWVRKVQKPSVQPFLPAKQQSTGQAVLICPGGGYSGLAYDWEGTDIAKWFNSKGVAAFVLKYRMPQSKSVVISHLAPIQDAQRAIRMIRARAKEWNIDKSKVGVIGFSAGGHLASTLSTQFTEKKYEPKDSIDTYSARPDFSILVYPVISMKESVTHEGSRDQLLGPDPDMKLIQQYSNEQNVSKDTPPTFLVHAIDDKAVPAENSLLYYSALKEENVSAELHAYPYGGHGFSLAIGQGHLEKWTDRLSDWLSYLSK